MAFYHFYLDLYIIYYIYILFDSSDNILIQNFILICTVVLMVLLFVLQMIPLDSFVGQSADGKMVPIIPGGNSIPLTFSNRKEYVERAIEYRLHEIDRQVRED